MNKQLWEKKRTLTIQKTETSALPRGVMSRPALRGPVNLLVLSFAFGQIWTFMIQSLPMTQMGKFLNISAFGFGLLGGLLTYGQLAQLLGSYLVERYGHRKFIVITSALIARSVWLPIAFLPLFTGNWTWQMLLGLAVLSLVFLNLSVPPTTSWLATIVPGRIQGRFFARRMQVGLITSMIAMLLISYILDKTTPGGNTVIKVTLISLFLFSAIIGILEYVLYFKIPDPPYRSTGKANLSSIMLKPLTDPEFVCFIFYYCMIALSTVFMWHFMFLFLLDVIGLSNVQITILVTVIPNIIIAISYPFWGKIADCAGYKPVMLIGGIAFALCSWWLLFATPLNWLIFYIFSTLAYFFMPAFETGYAVLMFTKVYGQGKSELGSSYPAVMGIAIALGGVVASLLSGTLASCIGTSWQSSIWGHKITYHWVIFLIAIAMRTAAFIWLWGIKNTKQMTVNKTAKLIVNEAVQRAAKYLFLSKK